MTNLSITQKISQSLSHVSVNPGVYLMKDEHGTIIYVGKARNLKKRLSSYFVRSRQTDLKTSVLVKKIASFETIVTGNEKEALILEANLIRKHKPRYNVVLKDDKRYPSLRLDMTSPFPNLTIVRKIKNDGAKYFGPFSSSQAVRQTLNFINKTFKLRRCRHKELKPRTRPCLNYQMGLCLAPCYHKVDQQTYREVISEVILFLKGRTPHLINKIRIEMHQASENQDFESAAGLRDKLYALQKTLEKQMAVITDFKDRDVIGMTQKEQYSVITVLYIRGGFLLGSRNYFFSDTLSDETELMASFIRQYYEKNITIPKEILVPFPLDDHLILEEFLGTLGNKSINIIWPQKGEKKQLLDRAIQNAQNHLNNKLSEISHDNDLLTRLQKRLGIENTPVRIESFDNSNLNGKSPVSCMVVFEHGKPLKKDYRTFIIKTVEQPDDYASMREVLERRYGKKDHDLPVPDLIMVDGGKGQLSIAVSVLKSLDMLHFVPVIGIAKRDEKRGETQDKIFVPGRMNPVNFGKENDLLLFLEKVRDETHRFAISFHRKRRSKQTLTSGLDQIQGIGKKRKQMLLDQFGAIENIKNASVDELIEIPGITSTLAHRIKSGL